jgi:mannose-6-phosphate isomerase-like protein (cupin superfamily)
LTANPISDNLYWEYVSGRIAVGASGDVIANPITNERIIFRKTAADTNGVLLQFEDILEAGGIGPPEHVHPSQQERFEVLAGTFGVRVGGKERVVGPGTIVVVEPGQPHVWWNAGTEPLRVLTEFRPAFRTELFFETLFGLARDGKLDARGMPRFLQVVAMVPPFDMYLAKPPIVMQKVLFTILGPLARLRGYLAVYPRYSSPVVQRIQRQSV